LHSSMERFTLSEMAERVAVIADVDRGMNGGAE
jgi:hypothetical protein